MTSPYGGSAFDLEIPRHSSNGRGIETNRDRRVNVLGRIRESTGQERSIIHVM